MTTVAVQLIDTTLAVSTPAPTTLIAALDPPVVLQVAPLGATLAVQLLQAGTLTTPAAQGPMGPQGAKGDPGPPGPPGNTPTLYPILSASSFTVAHGLPYPPRALLLDPTGSEVETDALYTPGQVTLVFPQPFSGSLYLG